MRNFFRLLGIIAMVAVIGFSMTACGGGGGGNVTLKISGLTDGSTYKVFPTLINGIAGFQEKSGVAENGTVTVSYTSDEIANLWGQECYVQYFKTNLSDGKKSTNKFKIESTTITLTSPSDFN